MLGTPNMLADLDHFGKNYKEEEEAQRKYDFAAHLSYVVFAIGWIVVLLGRLKGISLSAD